MVDNQPSISKPALVIPTPSDNIDKNNLKPGKLATITVDFFEDKNDNYEIKVYAGQVGLILDPMTDNIRIQDNESRVHLNIVLKEDEVLICFSTLSV